MAATLLTYHERRSARVEHAWNSSDEYLGTWARLSYLGEHDIDAKDFRMLIDGDVASHSEPSTLEAFISHHNRLLEARATLFNTQYSMGALLGEGGFSKVVRAVRKNVGQVALKCSGGHLLPRRLKP